MNTDNAKIYFAKKMLNTHKKVHRGIAWRCEKHRLRLQSSYNRVEYSVVILDTQLNQVITHCDLALTPEHPRIDPDHTRNFQNDAFGTYFLYLASPNNFPSLSHSLPQTLGNPPYFKCPHGPRFLLLLKWNKNISVVTTRLDWPKETSEMNVTRTTKII